MKRRNQLLITGVLLLALTGCMWNPVNIEDITDDSSSSAVFEDEPAAEESMEENEESVEEAGSSYNAYLYATGSLSDPIPADNFGFASSAAMDNADRRLEEGDFEPVGIQLSKEHYEEIVNRIESHSVDYVYADLYNVENAYTHICEYEDAIGHQKDLHTNLITDIHEIPTVEQMRNVIGSNTEAYLQSHTGYHSLDSEYTELVAQILVNMVSEHYAMLSEEDITRIYCMLKDVTVVGIDSTDFTVNDLKTVYNARVTEDAVVMLDTDMMGSLRGNQIVERTIAHEVAHLFQRMCPEHRIQGFTQIGGSQYIDHFDDTGEVNSLHYQWLYEAAAELMSMNEYGANTALVYKNMVGYLHTLNLITLIRPEYDENSIAASQMSTDPHRIFEVFGAETDEEKLEIVYMLFSICYIQNDREDFAGAYEAVNGDIEGQETTVKKIMKESIVQTMTKYFYKNLAERVHSGDVILQDVFYLINTFEAALNLHIVYEDAERYEYNDESLKFYTELQNLFFEQIAADSEMTYESIVESFGQYALVRETDTGYQRNYQFSWLDAEEKEYIGRVLTTNIASLTVNIRDLEYMD